MCIIIVGKGVSIPDIDALEESCIGNPDGFGWAIVARHADGTNRLVTGKSMRDIDAIDDYTQAHRVLGERVLYSVFHARIATHGTTNLDNCHPFQIGDDTGSVLFHNGIMSECYEAKSERSDTRIFAEDWLPEFGGVPALVAKPKLRELVEAFAVGSKLVVASVDLDLPLILNEHRGTWNKEKTLWFSNTSWRYSYPTTTIGNGGVYRDGRWQPNAPVATSSVSWDNDEVMPSCDFCESALNREGKCETCMMCQECGGTMSDVFSDGSSADAYCASCEWCEKCREWLIDCRCPAPLDDTYDTFPLNCVYHMAPLNVCGCKGQTETYNERLLQEGDSDEAIKLSETLARMAILNGVTL